MNYQKVIKKPIITEKVTRMVERENKYVFEVSRTATKGQIKEAVEKLYGVTVLKVNVLRNAGRNKRSLVKRSQEYRSKDIKKAVVALKGDDTIKAFEGAKS